MGGAVARCAFLASARIGHPRLLENDHGLIVEPHTPARWAEVLTGAAEGALRLAVGPAPALRTIREAAEESAALYGAVAGRTTLRSE